MEESEKKEENSQINNAQLSAVKLKNLFKYKIG
jgi:hypothetical protein